MKSILTILSNNRMVLTGILLGLAAGYLYWYFYACYWGIYPLSAECWVNCSYGAITGGFLACLIKGDY